MSDGPVKILALAGSTRSESLNKRLIEAVAALADPASAEVEVIDLRDSPLPLYDGDLEDAEGIPENVAKLAAQIAAADAVIISTPEYNKMLTGVLKIPAP